MIDLDDLAVEIRTAVQDNDLSIRQLDMFILELESLRNEF
jgi:hypothetical protein